MKDYPGGIEVTLNLPKGQSLHFPARCSKCLKMYPDKDFKVGMFKTDTPFTYSGTIYSSKAPICSSCHKFTKGLRTTLHPIKMTSPPPNVSFWFENVTYGNMFKEANSSSVVSTFPPFPQPIPDMDTLATLPGSTEPVNFHRGGGILGILAGIISLIWFAWWTMDLFPLTVGPVLALVLSILIGGIVPIVGGVRAYRGNRKSGGVLIILGGILALPNFIGLSLAIFSAIFCLRKPMTRGDVYKSSRGTPVSAIKVSKVCSSCNSKFRWYLERCPYCGTLSSIEKEA